MALNQKVAEILFNISEYLAMQNVPFKPRAYEKAGEAIASSADDVEDIYKREGIKGLKSIPGVGASIAEAIEELILTGKIAKYEELKKKTPVNVAELSRVEGLGPKSIRRLHQLLGITDVKSLEEAAKAGKIAPIKGFGKKTQDNILRGIEFLKGSTGRFIVGYAVPKVRTIEERLRKIRGAERVIAAGSFRRRKETIGDIDILVVADNPEEIMDAFVAMPEVVSVYAKGKTKSSARFYWGLDVDVRVVPRESYGAALLYFTGSKDHNVALRQLAIDKGFKLNEYGLFKVNTEKMVAGESEEQVYEALGLQYIPPEMRENGGEIEAALKGELPSLIEYGSLLGDLQIQTEWTDGNESIEDMAKAAMARGLKYIAITDHTKNLAMTNGLNEKRILEQMKEIDKLNAKFKGKFRILKGTECDILKDGSMDLPDEILSKLDIVGASIHSHFRLPKEEQTKRMLKAMENPHVDIVFHPTTRIIQKREPCELDMDAIILGAKRTRTVLEIDAYPDRTDLRDEYIRKCVENGVKMTIDSDAHAIPHLDFLDFGVSQARRGWAKKDDIINAWPAEKMLKMLKKA